MPTIAATRTEQGFSVFTLRTASLELSAVPELGTKIISLKNLRTNREWMSCRSGGMRLFRNRPGDDFATSTLVGWDECLPTIAPCTWKSRTLPDHGEVWSVPWEVDQESWRRGVLSTRVRLSVSPLVFQRTIELADREVQLRYALTNEGDERESFLWAMHPLLTIHDGDRFDLSPEVRDQLSTKNWIDSLTFDNQTPACAKVFAGPLSQGRAGIVNPAHR